MDMGCLYFGSIGFIIGWLSGQVLKDGGCGLRIDVGLGLLGGVMGAWVFDRLGLWPGGGILIAWSGSVVLLWAARLAQKA